MKQETLNVNFDFIVILVYRKRLDSRNCRNLKKAKNRLNLLMKLFTVFKLILFYMILH